MRRATWWESLLTGLPGGGSFGQGLNNLSSTLASLSNHRLPAVLHPSPCFHWIPHSSHPAASQQQQNHRGIPGDGLSKLTGLTRLSLGRNQLSGSIPDTILPESLQHLDLSSSSPGRADTNTGSAPGAVQGSGAGTGTGTDTAAGKGGLTGGSTAESGRAGRAQNPGLCLQLFDWGAP